MRVRRAVEWPAYSLGSPNTRGLLIAISLNAPFTGAAVPLIIKGTCELSGKPVPSEAILGAWLLFASSVAILR
jgi:hypothetical protein